MVGDVDAASLRAAARKAPSRAGRGATRSGPCGRRGPAATAQGGARREAQGLPDLPHPGDARASPAATRTTSPAQVLFQVLGGGSSSRLFRELREDKGYTYGLSARESAQKLGGVSYLGGRRARRRHGARPSRTCSRQVNALRDVPVPEAELADARNGIIPRPARRLRHRCRDRRAAGRAGGLRPARRLLGRPTRPGSGRCPPPTSSGWPGASSTWTGSARSWWAIRSR